MDFGIQIFGRLRITDNIAIYLTETLVVVWVLIAVLIAFAVVVKIKSKKWEAMGKPTGLQNIAEFAVGTFDAFFKNNASEKLSNLAPWFFTLFVFLSFANIVGVIGVRPPTADWGLTFPLAFASFLMFQYAGLRYRPKNYIKGFFKPMFLFFLPNFLGELAKPVSLSFRLFGNVLGGVVLISLLYGLAPFVFRIGLPAFLHAYFDLAIGLLQAFIFTMLSLAFLGLAVED